MAKPKGTRGVGCGRAWGAGFQERGGSCTGCGLLSREISVWAPLLQKSRPP